jgi:NAD(P)-dependent dehydrogenase (short-subunit alcohol dehydrogenase family)
MQPLSGRVAVVTGGGSGIGRAIALALARRQVRVVVVDRDADRATAVERELVAAAGDGVGRCGDVTVDDDLVAARDLCLDRWDRVDIVVNNAGVLAVGRPEDIPLAEWERVIDVNLLSLARSLHVFLPTLLSRADGHIVNTASTNGLYPYSFDRLPYSATKAAIVAVSEALTLYTRPRGVGVSCLCPGPVNTNIAEQVHFSGELLSIRPPSLGLVEPAVVGDLVVDAIESGRFLVLTHREVHDILVRRAADPDQFLTDELATLEPAD